jgi:hypothetical protein
VANTLHVVPRDDLVEHDSSTGEPDCVCGPTPTLVRPDNGREHWLLLHHALDRRP